MLAIIAGVAARICERGTSNVAFRIHVPMGDPVILRQCSLVLAFMAMAAGIVIPDRLVSAEQAVPQPRQGATRIAFVHQGSAAGVERYFTALRERLKELGYVEGRDLVIEARWADGHADRLPGLMAEVVERKVEVIVTGATPGAMAARNATSTIPIVATTMADPVRNGLVASVARPGGNLTGLSMGFSAELPGKWLELLQETVPRLKTVAVIANLANPAFRPLNRDVAALAAERHLQQELIDVPDAGTLESAFAQAHRHAQAVLLFGDAVTLAHQREITSLAARYRIPVMYNVRPFVDEGGLMAYAPDMVAQYRRAADYVDKILKGAKPADLPIEQPTKFELVINLKTAKALGITIPESILLRADEVIR